MDSQFAPFCSLGVACLITGTYLIRKKQYSTGAPMLGFALLSFVMSATFLFTK